jgi:hypothetical protein
VDSPGGELVPDPLVDGVRAVVSNCVESSLIVRNSMVPVHHAELPLNREKLDHVDLGLFEAKTK